MMLLQLAIWGAYMPKLYPYMGLLKFEAWQQSLVGSAWGIAAIIGIFFSNQFADRNFSAERFLAASNVIGGAALLGCAYFADFWPFFGCYLIFSLVYVPSMSVANAIAFANLRDPAAQFGVIRMGGTIGWIMVSWPFFFLLSAKAGAEEIRLIFVVAAIVSFAFAAYSLTLPHTPPNRSGAGTDPLAWRKAIKILGIPAVFVLFLVTFIDSTVHNGYFMMVDDYLTKRVGIDANVSMLVQSLGQVAEIVTMFVLGYVLIRLGWKWTMIIGVLGHAARFLAFGFFPDSVPTVIAMQLLHGICYAFFFATVYIFVDSAFPKDVRSSAQGLFNLLILGIGVVAANYLFAPLMAMWTDPLTGIIDYRTLFMVPAGMAVVAVLLLAVFFRPAERAPASVAAT
ncbi:MAG: MFS transporter [Rhodobacterales bacterium 12-64-8]|nr:MAG: MFS transporter [Rhodobacterales bacterium 12-64-8]OYX49056.1 MAG: MFS transporter [Alphaproteobacteria bacterium 32-64-14]